MHGLRQASAGIYFFFNGSALPAVVVAFSVQNWARDLEHPLNKQKVTKEMRSADLVAKDVLTNMKNPALKDFGLDMGSHLKQEKALSDLLVFSHLRWDFVFQRPQHLMTRFAKERRVFFIEEPVPTDLDFPSFHISDRGDGLRVVTPHMPRSLEGEEVREKLANLLEELVEDEGIFDFTSWYYTPMALPFTKHLKPSAIIYDCMDELSAFKGAPKELLDYEKELLECADVVFTGGQSLFEAKRDRHANVHAFPSSIDVLHFSQARYIRAEPQDQLTIRGPRLGFFGVLDERFDAELIDGMAALRPDWQIVLIGPVVKIDPASLPQRPNIHYLGMKDYQELPRYLAGWDVAILPFAKNESTKFISPTKTPEYLAGGRPVVSTSIRDVVRPYGEKGLVQIADTPEEFVRCAERAMKKENHGRWLEQVDAFLGGNSWDMTCEKMQGLERAACEARMAEYRTLTVPSMGVEA
jgi:UDP-galactopyranose mutase